MNAELPAPIDDSLPYPQSREREQEEEEQFYQQQDRYYYQQPPPLPPRPVTQKKVDVFSELSKTHWILFVSAVLLAFFMGKSISTPIILRSS